MRYLDQKNYLFGPDRRINVPVHSACTKKAISCQMKNCVTGFNTQEVNLHITFNPECVEALRLLRVKSSVNQRTTGGEEVESYSRT